jgi:hypothetical protein
MNLTNLRGPKTCAVWKAINDPKSHELDPSRRELFIRIGHLRVDFCFRSPGRLFLPVHVN